MLLRPVVLALGTLVFGITLAPLASPAFAAEAAPEPRAHVDVTVKATEGAAVHLSGSQLEWDGSATLRANADDRVHAVEITMRRSDDGKLIHVALRYAVDGTTMVASKDVSATLAEPVRIESADGKAEVVLTVKAEVPRKKIEIDSSDDPLSGI